MKKVITRSEVDHIKTKYKIRIDQFLIIDGLVHVKGDVRISHKNLTKLPLHFGRVNGDFLINDMNLKSLKGCPAYVGRDFFCNNNDLKSLQHGPKIVDGSYDCSENKLTTLIGCAVKIGYDLRCNMNQLVSLKGSPEKITGMFNCKNNKLRSLTGLPKSIYGRFNVSHNLLVHFFKENQESYFKFFGEMFATSNFLENLKGLPEEFEGLLFIDRSTKSINTGGVVHKKMRLEIRILDRYGFQFMSKLLMKYDKYIDLIFKYQYYYDIWDESDYLVEEELLGLVADIKEGLK